MRLRTSVAILGLAPVLALLTGCDGALRGDWNYTEDFHYSYPLAANGQLELENFNGPIEITGWDQPNVDVSGTKYASTQERLKDLKVDVAAMPSSVVIRTMGENGGFSWGGAGIRYEIRVPRRAQIRRISNTNGPVRLDTLDSGATVRTTNGPVHASQIRGAWDIQTSNGPVVLDGVSGSLDIRTSNGPVQLTLDKAGEVRARTSNGPITVHVPDGVGGEIRAHTTNGPIHSDFDLSGGYEARHQLEGTFGGGGPLLDLATTNGPIRISKL